MLEVLLGYLAKTLNMPVDEVKSLITKEDNPNELKEDALSVMLASDASRMTTFREQHRVEKDDQYKRAVKEVSKDWETRIRSNFNISDASLTGDDLIAQAVKLNPGKTTTTEGELTEDQVKAHPLYISLQNAKKKEVDDLNAEWEQKLNNTTQEFSQKETRANVNSYAINYIKSKNPVLPTDAEKAQKRLNAILPNLDAYKIEQNGTEFILKNKDGHQAVDAHNNPISINSLLDNLADDYFDFDNSGGEGGSDGTGNKNEFGEGRFKHVKVPDSPEALKQATKDAKSSEERQAIVDAYMEKQKTKD